MGSLSQRHETIVGTREDQPRCLFLISRKCNLEKHEVRHKFLYLPDYPVALMGTDLLCKLRTQITFNSDDTSALKLRGPEAKIVTLVIVHEEEW
jgi:hypothetical protein